MKIWSKTKDYSEGKFLVVRRDGSIPHWPHFVLGARDPASIAALLAYAQAARDYEYDEEYCKSVEELADTFKDYRETHGTGNPPAGPHRRDNQKVISAMRGKKVFILVKPDRDNSKPAVEEESDDIVSHKPDGTPVTRKEMEEHTRAYYHDPDGDSDGQ